MVNASGCGPDTREFEPLYSPMEQILVFIKYRSLSQDRIMKKGEAFWHGFASLFTHEIENTKLA